MKRLIIAGIVTFLLVLVATFPAHVAYNWFAPAEIQLSGISGSVWNGQAREGQAAGAYLQNLSWQFKPAALITGKLAFTASGEPAAGHMTTDIAIGLNGNLTLSNFVGSVPLDLVHQTFQQSGIRGDIIMNLENLVIEDRFPIAAQGMISITNLYVPLLSTTPIGDFRADFHSNDGNIVGIVADVDAILDVEGTITLLTDGSYTFIGQVAATAYTPASITTQLVYLGSPDERGKRPFRFEGRL